MRPLALLAVLPLGYLPSAWAEPPEMVGRTAVVVEQVVGNYLEVVRHLAVKDEVHLDELITTMPKSASDIVFLDVGGEGQLPLRESTIQSGKLKY